MAETDTQTETKPALTREKKLMLPSAVLDIDVVAAAGGGEGGEADEVFAACLDGGIYRVDVASGKYERLAAHGRYASGVHRVPGTSTLISAGYDGELHWHDLAAGAGGDDDGGGARACHTFRRVQAHRFWSWQSALSPDGRRVASATGRYQCGGYRYEPAPEVEPSVRVYDTRTGGLLYSLPHVPPVQAVAFSRDGRYLAAGNLMGEVRVWDLGGDGDGAPQVAGWTTGSFTGWGIIKGHYYTGGVFSIAFAPGDAEVVLAGMGSTRDPAAGNGKQLWQRFAWKDDPPRLTGETGDSGQGLMESVTFHPGGRCFAMAGRLESGQWNAALFDSDGGGLLASTNTKARVARAAFSPSGERLYLAGANSQPKLDKEGNQPPFGRLDIYRAEGV